MAKGRLAYTLSDAFGPAYTSCGEVIRYQREEVHRDLGYDCRLWPGVGFL